MDKIYIVSNIVFLPIDPISREVSTKYFKSTISGEIYSLCIYTKEEILAKYPNAKECKSLLEIKEMWSK